MIQIDWIIDTVSGGKIYEQMAEYVQDDETRAFLEMQIGSTSRQQTVQDDVMQLNTSRAAGALYNASSRGLEFGDWTGKSNSLARESKGTDGESAGPTSKSIFASSQNMSVAADGHSNSIARGTSSGAEGMAGGEGGNDFVEVDGHALRMTSSSGRTSPQLPDTSKYRRATRFVRALHHKDESPCLRERAQRPKAKSSSEKICTVKCLLAR